jgi:hypothetical protein
LREIGNKVADCWESFEIPLFLRNIPLCLLTRRQSEGEIMTSDKKAQANRHNALKSTGPKTPEGKASVRHNALKHGLLTQEVLLPEEDEEALRELDERLRAELQPEGEMEDLLVEQIVATQWRLRRMRRVEAGVFDWESSSAARSAADSAAGYLRRPIPEGTSMLGLSFIRDANGANAFSKLSRYETAIERSLYKALHELQRLQAARRAEEDVPPPLAVDVNVSGVSREDL